MGQVEAGKGAEAGQVSAIGEISEVGTLRRRVAALEAEVARLQATPGRSREAELRIITDALPVLVAYVDRDYAYRFNNRHYETWFGLGIEEVTGRHVREVLGAEAFAERRPFMDRALAGEAIVVDGFLPDRAGRRRACTIQYIPRRSESGTVEGFFVLAIDIDERRAAEVRRIAVSELGDRLRDLEDTAEIAFAASEILGTTLGVSRAGYGTIDPAAETILIERDWNAPGIRSLAGTLHFRDYGSYIADLKSAIYEP